MGCVIAKPTSLDDSIECRLRAIATSSDIVDLVLSLINTTFINTQSTTEHAMAALSTGTSVKEKD